MAKFAGECVGGPLNEKLLVHWASTCKLLRPVLEFSLAKPPQALTVEAVPLGEYRYAEGLWIWCDHQ